MCHGCEVKTRHERNQLRASLTRAHQDHLNEIAKVRQEYIDAKKVIDLQLQEARLEIVSLKVCNAAADLCNKELRSEKGVEAIVARVTQDAKNAAWREVLIQEQSRKDLCVDKCNHPAGFVCGYEDGTFHCLECLAEKEVWSK